MVPAVLKLEWTYAASPEEIWRLWTTKEGLESWWPPEGFTAEVHELDLRPGGDLRYTFTAVEEPQIEFLRSVGMPEDDGTHVVMTMDPLHDDEWTQRLVAGRENELANLERVLG